MVDILHSNTKRNIEYPDFKSLESDFPQKEIVTAIEEGRSTIKDLMKHGGIIDTVSGVVLTLGTSNDGRFSAFINDEKAPKKAMQEGHRGVFIFQYNELMARLNITLHDINELFQRHGMGGLEDRGKGYSRQTVRIVLPGYHRYYSKFSNMHVSYQSDFAGVINSINIKHGFELRDKEGKLLDRRIVRLAFEELRREDGLDVERSHSFNENRFE